MIQKVKKVLKKRKAKLFFLFLFLSGLAWFISNLSNRYQSDIAFDLAFVNPPDSMMLISASQKNVEAKLDAVGFQFLLLNLGKRKIEINLSDAIKRGNRYSISSNTLRRQITKQLMNGVKLLEVETDTLFFDFYDVVTKKVPVKPVLDLKFAQNHLMNGSVQTTPDSVTIKGPKNEVDGIKFLQTNEIALADLSKDFSVMAKLDEFSGSEKVIPSITTVEIHGKVSRFSEKIIQIPVNLINLPENTKAQTFPERVDVLIKASVTNLKKIKPNDFKVTGDYTTITESGQKSIVLSIPVKPASIHAAELLQNQVDFILKRE